MTSAIKYCIWDVGKTIYPYTLAPLDEWAAAHASSPELYKQKHGVFAYDYDPYMRGEVGFADFCADLCRHCGIPQTSSTAQEINKALHAGVGRPYPETLETMAMLKRRGISNGILSNALPILDDTAPVEGLVEPRHVFTSFELGLLKPDVRIFQAVRRRLGCRFKEMMFIDDKNANVEAARSLGIHGIVCRHENLKSSVLSVLQPETKAIFSKSVFNLR